MFRETHARSVAKAVSWRVMGTLATTVLVFVFTRRLTLSLAVGALEFVSKIGLFWLHERMWDRYRFGRREVEPAVIWLTGLSGAGKSTIADRVFAELRHRGLKVERLDGDTVRDIFPATGFTRPERDAHLRRVGYLASKLEGNGVYVVASFVSPYEESRRFVRGLCRRFIEVHVDTSIEECERRDVKGLYARARRGEIRNFTGIDDPYETPVSPELRLDTAALSVEEAGARVLAYLDRNGGRS
ncbi:MAG TPA: adenylyl-sulfate kinase [Gemmatimonadales bacterium]|nr:adenylyl-sulfate kinase [Gemmatimonadales bacterium]